MGTTKVLVVANAPGILQRVEESLAGLEVHDAIRLRDVAGAVRQGGFKVVVLYMGFEPQSAVELIATLSDGLTAHPLAVVCIAPPLGERDGNLALRELEARVREAGACDFIDLAHYARTPQGNDALRKRILEAAARERQADPVVRVLRRAVRIAGGYGRLAAHLGVAERDLLRWMGGDGEAPEPVFLAAFDLVLMDLERGSGKPN